MSGMKKILLISGKRKSGKDYISSALHNILSDRSQIVRISTPIKGEWAKRLNLNLNELLSDGPYKENFRKDMIEWSDSVRAEDYGYFCRAAMLDAKAEIIIVSDIRRKTDIKYFRETYGPLVYTVRINTKNTVRIDRGWIFTSGVDDVVSECDLDDYQQWDLVLENNCKSDGEECIKAITTKCHL
ncbi:probable phosphomevalonate kinase [Rhagoletis pomonella]|uniref:probable phosphomevalonate kinase n=1 Tax=Rhagoletis pomonella TaxID=28610 RepID=UPI001780DF96|nr:probable phosphomevalonate kinase [Rhagoletis pomonella]XP_036331052.1 probable phosphomevalonate kinase [Rhagoletis pomonella]XP_036331053.1 probable phosphomevalonate kinase [Rhagoletis pomonella]XP_036331054.1 probable phosphomevalonate kinase [Rhagoletis pomonella]